MLALSINLVDSLKELRERTFNPEKKQDTEADEVKVCGSKLRSTANNSTDGTVQLYSIMG